MSLKTDNFELFKYEDNDLADLRFLHGSMDIIDKGINPFYVATLDSANTYKVTTGLNKTVLNDGYSIKVAIPSNSTGAVSIIVDSVTVPLKKVNGNDVTNLKANGVYSLTYYNSVFILASGGVDDVNFTSDKLLSGYSANDSNGEKINGTMPNNGAKTATLNCGGSYTIPKGYHNGSGKVTANSLSSQTGANATAKDIVKGKTAWVNGSKLTGTATIQSLGGKRFATGKIDFSNLSRKTSNPYSNRIFTFFTVKISIPFTPKCVYGILRKKGTIGVNSGKVFDVPFVKFLNGTNYIYLFFKEDDVFQVQSLSAKDIFNSYTELQFAQNEYIVGVEEDSVPEEIDSFKRRYLANEDMYWYAWE